MHAVYFSCIESCSHTVIQRDYMYIYSINNKLSFSSRATYIRWCIGPAEYALNCCQQWHRHCDPLLSHSISTGREGCAESNWRELNIMSHENYVHPYLFPSLFLVTPSLDQHHRFPQRHWALQSPQPQTVLPKHHRSIRSWHTQSVSWCDHPEAKNNLWSVKGSCGTHGPGLCLPPSLSLHPSWYYSLLSLTVLSSQVWPRLSLPEVPRCHLHGHARGRNNWLRHTRVSWCS